MYYFDSRIERDELVMNEWIEKEMQLTKRRALQRLASVVHPKFDRVFADILIYSWMESQESAEKIANQLDLDKLDFLAIQEDFDAFKEEFLNEKQQALNF